MNLEQLVVELESADLRRRNALARAAAQTATEDDLREVIRLLVHPVKPVRLGAMEVLAYARFRPAMPYLVDVTRKRTGDDRVLAARAVAAMVEPGDSELATFARQWVASGDPILELHGATVLTTLGLDVRPLVPPPAPAPAQPSPSNESPPTSDPPTPPQPPSQPPPSD